MIYSIKELLKEENCIRIENQTEFNEVLLFLSKELEKEENEVCIIFNNYNSTYQSEYPVYVQIEADEDAYTITRCSKEDKNILSADNYLYELVSSAPATLRDWMKLNELKGRTNLKFEEKYDLESDCSQLKELSAEQIKKLSYYLDLHILNLLGSDII